MPNSQEIEPCDSPVFVLTASRSGSTLLRFLLDSHPDLACPPETSVASAAAGLARSWDLLENAGAGNGRPVNAPADLQPHAAMAIRDAIGAAFGSYLQRRGKRRWCDKSLDTYQFPDLIRQVYPDAKFICLYRHCMDVIASGVEACPWGLHRFGFDPFVAQYPGNSVAAIGSYWQSCAQAIMAFESRHPQACHRVRYEDLVTAPQETSAAIFSFLGLESVPGIVDTCFQTAHEGDGPGDEKIWFTTGVTADSLGRGITVPAAALPEPLLRAINDTLAKLDYRPVDHEWNTAVVPADPRAHLPGPVAEPAADDARVTAVLRAITDRVNSRPDAGQGTAAGWPGISGSTVAIIVQGDSGDPGELRLRFPEGKTAAEETTEPTAKIIASPATWLSLLDGKVNLVAEITAGRLRCVNKRDGHRIRSDELHAVATLLGISRIPMARTSAAGSRDDVGVPPAITGLPAARQFDRGAGNHAPVG